MKKLSTGAALLLCVAFATSNLFAQEYKSYTLDKVPFDLKGVYYSLPQTELVFDVTVEKTTEYKGCYADYSYMLGLRNIIIKDGVSYRIKDIKLRPRAVADSRYTYFLATNGNVEVQIGETGTLLSINKTVEKPRDCKHNRCTDRKRRPNHQNDTLFQPKPTFEQRMLSLGMLEAMPGLTPEKAVKQIEKLRERQVDILSGSVDGTYMNTTVEYMYKQLDAMIDSYVSLFTGERVSEELHYTFSVIPQKPLIVEQDLLVGIFKFSEQEGAKPLSYKGDMPTIIANLHSLNTTKEYTKIEAQKEKDEKLQRTIEKKGVGVYYCIPEQVEVSVSYGEKTLMKTLEISQFGQVSYMLASPSQLIFDSATGALKYMGK